MPPRPDGFPPRRGGPRNPAFRRPPGEGPRGPRPDDRPRDGAPARARRRDGDADEQPHFTRPVEPRSPMGRREVPASRARRTNDDRPPARGMRSRDDAGPARAAPARAASRAKRIEGTAKASRAEGSATTSAAGKSTARKGPPEPGDWVARGVRLIFAAPGVMVLDKPPGMSVTLRPGERVKTAAKTLTLIAEQVAKLIPGLEGGKPRPVTTLDPEASGLVVFGLDDDIAARLRDHFRSGDAPRVMLAVIEPIGDRDTTPHDLPDQSDLTVDIRADAKGRVAPARDDDDARARAARTSLRVIARGHRRAVVELTLHTERPGQVHIHLQSIGWRAVAEASRDDGRPRLLIHLSRLTLPGDLAGTADPALSLPAPPAFALAAGLMGLPQIGTMEKRTRSRVVDEAPAITPPPPAASGPAAAKARVPKKGAPTAGGTSKADETTADSWDHVAAWYGEHIRSGAGDHQDELIVPGVIRLVSPSPGERVLDIACGEGRLCRELTARGVETVGIDLSPSLVEAAGQAHQGALYEVLDARKIDAARLGAFDAATCVMAIMNIDRADEVLRGAASVLSPGGRLVLVLLHPAFRAPGRTSWGWDSGPPARQYRRVDAYLSEASKDIVMNPGAASSGAEAITTTTYHRPIGAYVAMLAEAGFTVDALEEWASLRRSEPGPRAKEENRARGEFPLLLAIRARKA